MDMSVDESAYDLLLLMVGCGAVLGVLFEEFIQLAVDGGCESVDDMSFVATDPGFHRFDIIAFGLAPMRIIAPKLHLSRLEVVTRVVFVRETDRADVERFDGFEEVRRVHGEHM